jgi:hypothetical protein
VKQNCKLLLVFQAPEAEWVCMVVHVRSHGPDVRHEWTHCSRLTVCMHGATLHLRPKIERWKHAGSAQSRRCGAVRAVCVLRPHLAP